MTTIELNALQELMGMGFQKELVRPMIRFGELPAPLTDGIRENAVLLSKYVELASIGREQSTQLMSYLRREPTQNRFMESVPERYDFSAEEAEKYRANPLHWDMSIDLRAELDEALSRLVRSEEARERIYREMYISGAWQSAEEILQSCAALAALDCPPDELDDFVREQYVLLFSYYSDTVACLSCLGKLFAAEHILDVLREEPTIVRAFSRHFNPFNDREKLLDDLKGRHPGWLKA